MEVLEFEKRYWKAMEQRDIDTVKNLTRFPCIITGKTGVRKVDETEFHKNFESSKNMQMKVLEISDITSQAINETTTIIAYIVKLEYVVDGQVSTFCCACTSTWVKENDQWLCAMHTESDLEK